MIVLTPSKNSDADFIVGAESNAETARFIIPWARERHMHAMADPDCVNLIVKESGTGDRVGFVMLFGVALRDEYEERHEHRHPDHSLSP